VGYDLHITRTADSSFSEDALISVEEWEAAARAEPRLVDVAGLGWDSVPPAATFVWLDHDGPSLYWVGGEITVKGARSDEEVGAIAAFAARLRASLIGDDGESYDETGNPID
jgi:hypothetical protein